MVAHLRKGETYTDLAAGFGVGTTTVFRYISEAIEVLAALAPTVRKAVETAVWKAFVILDRTLLRIDRVGMGSGRAVIGRTSPANTNATARTCRSSPTPLVD
ncbi:MAG: hypothetical protein V7646_2303 [Pseudonocardia sp.]